MYASCNLSASLDGSTFGDIRELDALEESIRQSRPEIVFHLAAQSLVRQSYSDPVGTYSTNVMGTVNLLEAVRKIKSIKALVNVTTDKCYQNREWIWPYRECDRLGGFDPYSNSKACSELVTSAFRQSFAEYENTHLASARAGNVMGGGDWATDRLIPDFLRALDASKPLMIRFPHAVRPWQHVLEPLSGYLILAEKLYAGGAHYADAWNFGPASDEVITVEQIAEHLCHAIPGMTWIATESSQPHEAGLLTLDSSKSKSKLGWRPKWSVQTALTKTVEWHKAWKNGLNMAEVTSNQIREYVAT